MTRPSDSCQPELWDPLAAWPAGRKWLWALLAVLAVLIQGPTFVRTLTPAVGEGNDFFQEWASARNYFDGRPIYTSHEVTAKLYAGYERNAGDRFISYNAHPPPSVLLSLPFGLIGYRDATLLWNLFSLVAVGTSLILMARELGHGPEPWVIFPAVTLMLLNDPFRQQMNQGQLNGLLLLLITGSWLADRRGHFTLAGCLVGLAAAVKIYPGFLLGYFLLRRDWRAVAAGLTTISLLSLVSLDVLGVDAYRDYVLTVMPNVTRRFQGGMLNASLSGYWIKLFDQGSYNYEHMVEPVYKSLALTYTGIALSYLAILGSWAARVIEARTRTQIDHAFGLSLLAMLLLSPITWNHYFLLAALPLLLIWEVLPRRTSAQIAFMLLVIGLSLNPVQIFKHFSSLDPGLAWKIRDPFLAATILPYLTYLLIVLFAMSLLAMRWARESPKDAAAWPAAGWY